MGVVEKSAHAGSVPEQLAHAKEILTSSQSRDLTGNDDKNPEEDIKAVTLLMRACRHGSEEAVGLLDECLKTGQGITDEIKAEVVKCLNIRSDEFQVRKAASLLFQELQLPPPEEITRDLFTERVKEVVKDKRQCSLIAHKVAPCNAGIESETFVDTVTAIVRGKAPKKRQSSSTSSTVAAWVDAVMNFHTYLFGLTDMVMDLAASNVPSLLGSFFPREQVPLLALIYLYSIATLSTGLFIVPNIIFYISFLAMILSTLQLLQLHNNIRNMKTAAKLLNSYDRNISSDTIEEKHILQNLSPYWTFFISLFFTILAFGMTDKGYVPSSQIFLVGVFISVVCAIFIGDISDIYCRISYIIALLTMMSVVISCAPRIPIVSTLMATPIKFDIFGGKMQIILGLGSILYVALPVMFVLMSSRDNWKGVYTCLLPSLVPFAWWQFTLVIYPFTSLIGLAIGAGIYLSAAFMLPILAVVLFGWIVYTIIIHFTMSSFLTVITTLMLLILPLGLTFFPSDILVSGTQRLKKIAIVLSLVAVGFVVVYPNLQPDIEEDSFLLWDEYKYLCSTPQWEKTNQAHAQMICSHLVGMKVTWQGEIDYISIDKTDNQFESIVNTIPSPMNSWLTCLYGERYAECNIFKGDIEQDICNRYKKAGKTCHLSKFNQYTFEIGVNMTLDESVSQPIIIKAGHGFKDALRHLHSHDIVEFTGSLTKNLGTQFPKLELEKLKCVDCSEGLDLEDHITDRDNENDANDDAPATNAIKRTVRGAVLSVMSFLLGPLLHFST